MKKSIRDRRAHMNWGEEDKSTGVDMEMFGKALRYKSNVKETMLCNYFNDTSYSAILWESMAATISNTVNGQSPLPSINDYVSFLTDGLELLKSNAIEGLSVVETRVVVTDINPEVESMEHTRLSGILSNNEIELNNLLLHTVEHTPENEDQITKILNSLQELNKAYYEVITNIRQTITNSLVLVD